MYWHTHTHMQTIGNSFVLTEIQKCNTSTYQLEGQVSLFTFGLIWSEKKNQNDCIRLLYQLLMVGFFFFFFTTEKCDEDDLGGVGSSCGKHEAHCGQTGGEPSAEQHTQHQYRTYKSQHAGSDTSTCFLNHMSNVLWVHVTERISFTLSKIRRSVCPLRFGLVEYKHNEVQCKIRTHTHTDNWFETVFFSCFCFCFPACGTSGTFVIIWIFLFHNLLRS